MQSDGQVQEKMVLEDEIFPYRELPLELELVLDHEFELVWAIWWLDGDRLLVTYPAPEA